MRGCLFSALYILFGSFAIGILFEYEVIKTENPLAILAIFAFTLLIFMSFFAPQKKINNVSASKEIAEPEVPAGKTEPIREAELISNKTIYDFIRMEYHCDNRCSIYLKDNVKELDSMYFKDIKSCHVTDFKVEKGETIFHLTTKDEYINNTCIRGKRYEFFAEYEAVVIPFFKKCLFGCPSDLIIGQKLIEINYDSAYFAKYDDIVKEREEADAEEGRQLRLAEEKREIAAKLKERERRRTLEKLVKQELIEKGEIMPTVGREPIPRDIVDAVYSRDGGRCVYCGSSEKLQVDHIIPYSKGGADAIDNFQILCQKCNIEKSNKIG